MTLFYKEIESPVGKLKLVASSNALVAVLWDREQPNRVKLDTATLDPQHPILLETERQLTEYFSGGRTDFDLPLQPDGSEFQKKSLARLERDTVRSNQELSRSGKSSWLMQSCSRRWRRQQQESIVHHRAMSSGRRCGRIAYRLRRRTRDQSRASGSRNPFPHANE